MELTSTVNLTHQDKYYKTFLQQLGLRMTLLITTLLIMAILITLKMGDITKNVITYD